MKPCLEYVNLMLKDSGGQKRKMTVPDERRLSDVTNRDHGCQGHFYYDSVQYLYLYQSHVELERC